MTDWSKKDWLIYAAVLVGGSALFGIAVYIGASL